MKQLLAGCLLLFGAAASARPPITLKGTVSEVAHADGFTYLQVNTGKERLWAYGPKSDVRLRDEVTIPLAKKKRKVKSKELDHTFRGIYYVKNLAATVNLDARAPDVVAPEGTGDDGGTPQSQGLPAGHPTVRPGVKAPAGMMGGMPKGMPAGMMGGMPKGLPAGHPTLPGRKSTPPSLPAGHPKTAGMPGTKTTAPEIELVDVPKAEGGLTIAEIYARKTKLVGKEVLVRGQVIKVNANIMRRNWIHLRDGTGEKGTDDLTITTEKDLPKLGGVVLMRGTVAIDRDFGYGYAYSLIIENAVVAN